MIVWQLRSTMDRLGVSRYALQKHSRISMNTVRAMYDGTPERTDFRVIEQVIASLRHLTGHPITLHDVLGWTEEVRKAPGG